MCTDQSLRNFPTLVCETLVKKFNCSYCGYANGVLHYASVIAGRTEQYWCGVKHEKRNGFVEPHHHENFPLWGLVEHK